MQQQRIILSYERNLEVMCWLFDFELLLVLVVFSGNLMSTYPGVKYEKFSKLFE